MPLMNGSSKQAFSSNVGAEMDSGRPQKQALAIAYAVKRRNAKKMAKGGMVDDKEDESYSMNHSIDSHELARTILQKLAEGGEVEGHEMGDEQPDDLAGDENDEMFSDEADGEFDKMHMSEGGEVNPKLEAADERYPKKKILSGLMDRIRMKHMGR